MAAQRRCPRSRPVRRRIVPAGRSGAAQPGAGQVRYRRPRCEPGPSPAARHVMVTLPWRRQFVTALDPTATRICDTRRRSAYTASSWSSHRKVTPIDRSAASSPSNVLVWSMRGAPRSAQWTSSDRRTRSGQHRSARRAWQGERRPDEMIFVALAWSSALSAEACRSSASLTIQLAGARRSWLVWGEKCVFGIGCSHGDVTRRGYGRAAVREQPTGSYVRLRQPTQLVPGTGDWPQRSTFGEPIGVQPRGDDATRAPCSRTAVRRRIRRSKPTGWRRCSASLSWPRGCRLGCARRLSMPASRR